MGEWNDRVCSTHRCSSCSLPMEQALEPGCKQDLGQAKAPMLVSELELAQALGQEPAQALLRLS